MNDPDRISALERRVADLEEFAAEVRMRALTDWLEAHPADLAKCLRTGEPMVMEFTGATITRDELRGVLAELRNPASPC